MHGLLTERLLKWLSDDILRRYKLATTTGLESERDGGKETSDQSDSPENKGTPGKEAPEPNTEIG